MATLHFPNGSSDARVFTPVSSALGDLSNGAGTIVAMVKRPTVGAAGSDYAGLMNSAGNAWYHTISTGLGGGGHSLGDDDGVVGTNQTTTGQQQDATNWHFFSVSWPNSASTIRFHYCVVGGSWSHDNSAAAQGTPRAGPGTGGYFRIGSCFDNFSDICEIALVAVWNVQFADGDYGTWAQTSDLWNHALGHPIFLVEGTSLTPTDLTGGSTYSAANSTAASLTLTGSDPSPWTFDQTGGAAWPPAATPPAFATAGTGALTATSGAACTPGIPASVAAGDVLIAHVFYGAASAAPSTPAGWTLLSGPDSLPTAATNGRTWVFGKIAVAGEAAPAFGTQATTVPRRARVYRFTGGRTDSILNAVRGIAFEASAVATYTDVGVTTPEPGCLAVNLVAQADDTPAAISFTGETGGDWTEAVAEFTGTTGTPDTLLQLQTAGMVTVGTVNGGSQASGSAINRGITGLYIRPPAMPDLIMAPRVAPAGPELQYV